ncbi:MAG: hypothetical protein K8S87_09265 [Planctomycetes bacterium]|nr:hypothetical protein [Planctomycetota bacterium]
MKDNNNNAFKEEFEQAKVLAITKTAKSIKTVYSTMLIVFIVALVSAGVYIGKEFFSSGVKVIGEIKPPVNKIIHTGVTDKTSLIPLENEIIDLTDRYQLYEQDDLVRIDPIEDAVTLEDSSNGFNIKDYDVKILGEFQELINSGIIEFSNYDYEKSSKFFEKGKRYQEIPYHVIKRVNAYYDMTLCMIDICKDIEPFYLKFKLIKLTPPIGFSDKEFEGYVKKDVDLLKAQEDNDRIYLNYMHKNGGKFYKLSSEWKIEELPENLRNSALIEYFRVQEKSIKLISIENIHPMDYVNRLIKLAFEIGDLNGFDSKSTAHNYFRDAFEIDRYLFETINLHKDSRFFEWLAAIENNEIEKAVNLRKVMELNYPNAWEFRSDNPEEALIKRAKDESEKDTNSIYDPNNDPDVLNKRRSLAEKSTKEKIRYYSEYAKEAENRGDNGWSVVLKMKEDGENRNEIIKDAIDQWALAKYWYREAKKLTTDEIDSEKLGDKVTKLNSNIIWARRMITMH